MIKPIQHNFGERFDQLLARLGETAGELDAPTAWPRKQFAMLAEADVLGWTIPQHFGGSERTAEEMITGYLSLSQACLVTTFVLTQRNSACQRIVTSSNDELKERILPSLCTDEIFATVGISHLSTSRQHLRKPAITVSETDDGFILDGEIPWVTGAPAADYIMTGGTLEDGRQILVMVSTKSEAVSVEQPVDMLALSASQTGAVLLNNVQVGYGDVVAGPIEHVMKQGSGGGAGSITTSALAVGTAGKALTLLQHEAEKRPELISIFTTMAEEYHNVCKDLIATAKVGTGNSTLKPEAIREWGNSLALRSTQAYLAAAKGAGFVKGHPAERAVREAMFFLVWSCPQPIVQAALREFACLID